MERKIISSTGPNEEGELLWCVHFMSSYYDNDSRMPGDVPVDKRFYVLAKSKDEAEAKVKGSINKAAKKSDKNADKKIETSVVALENLIVARDGSKDGRMGWHSTTPLKPVSLKCEEDKKRYRLAVCLIPID